jgi:hypothetical protein
MIYVLVQNSQQFLYKIAFRNPLAHSFVSLQKKEKRHL